MFSDKNFLKRYDKIKNEHIQILVSILKFLSFKSVVFVSLTNHRFYQAAGDLSLLKGVTE